MEAIKAAVLFELALLALAAATVGVLLYGRRRRGGLTAATAPGLGGIADRGETPPDDAPAAAPPPPRGPFDKVRARSFDRLDLWAALGIALFLISGLAVPVLAPDGPGAMNDTIAGADPGATGAEGSPEGAPPAISPLALAIFATVANLFMGLGVFAYATFLRGRRPKELFGLDRTAPLGLALFGLGGLIAAFVAVFIGSVIWTLVLAPHWGPEPDLQQIVEIMRDAESPALRVVIVIAAVVVAPLVEETIFRGFLYGAMKRFTSRGLAAVTTSLLFAVVHSNVPAVLPLTALALLLVAAYELSGSLWVPIVIHALFNAVQTGLILSGFGAP